MQKTQFFSFSEVLTQHNVELLPFNCTVKIQPSSCFQFCFSWFMTYSCRLSLNTEVYP